MGNVSDMLEDLSADLYGLEPLAVLWANKVNMCIDYFTTVLENTATDNQGRNRPTLCRYEVTQNAFAY